MKTRRAVLATALALVLAGCAPIYTYQGQRFNSKQDFLAAVERTNSAAVETITPLPAPVTTKKLLFAFPGKEAIHKGQLRYYAEASNGATPNPMQTEMLQTLAEGNFAGAKVFYTAAQKRNIYKSVRFVELDSMTASPTASADEDVVYYYEAARLSGTYYYVTEKTGKQVFAYDRGAPTPAGKVKAFLDALQLQAIRQ